MFMSSNLVRSHPTPSDPISHFTHSIPSHQPSPQGADDGFREYTSMTQTFFTPIEDRVVNPVATDPYFHGERSRLLSRRAP